MIGRIEFAPAIEFVDVVLEVVKKIKR